MNGSSMETNIATNIESDFGEDLATNSNKENVIANGSQSSQRHRFKGEIVMALHTLAIDNKIEQAMDLVKSHLMFAVREEVDVLKERIKELESEIHILRAHATSDVLQLVLQQQSGQQMAPQERQREQQLE
ncbi:unnamed protein product [Medioppia subpectinata]|uniref:Uncharacterized protein n=1 Tax=Medioppia subpectinata TaxID=1979941 RepID=A0A7R9Q1G5_9ACAR|nr:unnamed protein product [Medioppia subpectinata]CAG2108520.1 unnamed protein product [Medioppia subpectinata]